MGSASEETPGSTTMVDEPQLPARFSDPDVGAAVVDQRELGTRAALPDAREIWGNELDHARAARDERGLVPIAGLRHLWVLTQIAAFVTVIADRRLGAILFAVSLGVLMMWSALAAVNVRRARPRTIYTRPPRPVAAMLWWLAPLAAIAGAVAVSRWWEQSDPGAVAGSDGRVFELRFLVALGAAVPVLAALYRPFAVLGRATAWAGGRRRSWQYFFLLPLLTAVLASLAASIIGLSLLEDIDQGTLSLRGSLGVAAMLGLILLPFLMIWWLGADAMAETEHAARMTWERRNFPEGEFDLTDEFVARAATAAYLATHPGG